MTLKELKYSFIDSLSGLYPSEEIQSFFNWLAEEYLGYSRFEVSVKANEEIPSEIQTKFSEALQRIQNHEPIQYVLGTTEFYGLPFKVTPATLIPRPETEELVEWIIKDSEKIQGSRFRIQDATRIPRRSSLVSPAYLDIGTGTGCIAISLAKHIKNAEISAIDISEEALNVAAENATLNKVEVHFHQADILKTKSLPQQYDVIVSNPPYVREAEKKLMQPNVLKHEPETALYVSNEDPLLFYRAIARLSRTYLTPSGILYFEINEYLSKEMKAMLEAEGFTEIALKKDIFGRFRMLKCSLVSS